MSRLLVVSADGHAGADAEGYRDYIDPAYRDKLPVLKAENDEFQKMFFGSAAPLPPEVVAAIDENGAYTSNGVVGGLDFERRLQELDREGVAAEVVMPGYQHAIQPFFSVTNEPHPPDLRMAGARAFHRWLADGIAFSQGRIVGVGEPGPCLDLEETIAELRWIADHGFKAINAPLSTGDPSLPPLHSGYWDPIWAVCEELGIVILPHAGWGSQQGRFQEFGKAFLKHVVGASDDFQKNIDPHASMAGKTAEHTHEDSPLALDMGPRRLVWQLMLGGALDRFPNLRIALTEIRADWIPATIRHLDERFDRGDTPLRRRPSEYWVTNFFATPSSIHLAEVEMRHEIGVDQLMFGTDYPHPEGTWPNTRDWIRVSFGGVPEDEVRKILGENALRCFGLDEAKLRAIAERIGPDSEDVLAPGHAIDPIRLEHFTFRAGFSRGAEQIDVEKIDSLLDEDLQVVAAR